MNRTWIRIFALGVSFGLALADRECRAAPTKWAILIGVEHYPEAVEAQKFAKLYGPTNDVNAMRKCLETEFKFDSANVVTLIDADATLGGVIGAFTTRLGSNVKKDDVVFVYFAGHGSTVPDLAVPPVEEDEADSSFLLFDSRDENHSGQRDLTDDMLYSLLMPFVDAGAHIFVATDACHSAGAVRGKEQQPSNPIRMAPAGSKGITAKQLPPEWPATLRFFEDDDAGRKKQPAVTHLAACRKHEAANEYEFTAYTPSIYGGVFTDALLRALRAAAHEESRWTYEDLLASIRWGFPGYVRLAKPQTPTSDGELSRRVFDGQWVVPPGRFTAVQINDWDLEIDAGTIAGVDMQTRFIVFDPAGTNLGVISMKSVGLDKSVARWDEAKPIAANDSHSRFVDWETLPSGTKQITIHDPTQVFRDFLGPLEIVNYETKPLYKAGSAQTDPSVREIVAPDGVVVFRGVIPERTDPNFTSVRQDAIDKLRDEVSFHALRCLLGTRSTERVSAVFRTPSREERTKYPKTRKKGAATADDPALTIGPDPEDSDSEHVYAALIEFRRLEGEPEYRCSHRRTLDDNHLGMLDVTNHSDGRLFLYVLSLMEHHRRGHIFPARIGEHIEIAPGETKPCPFLISVPPDWPASERFEDEYLVIVCSDRLDIKQLLERQRTRGPGDKTPRLLTDALRGEITRGGNVVEEAVFGTFGVCLSIELEQGEK